MFENLHKRKEILTIPYFPAMDWPVELVPVDFTVTKVLHKIVQMLRQEKQIHLRHNFFFVIPVESANKAYQALIRFTLIKYS